MAGAGNDFIIIDAIKGLNYKKLAINACNRTNGIGADGLLVFDKSKKANYKMRIINADGSEAEMCGNGARCMVAYIAKNNKPKTKIFSMETLSGIVEGEILNNSVRVHLSQPKELKLDIKIKINSRSITVHHIDTGVPHAIIFVSGLDKINVEKIGSLIRNHTKFKPRGVNTNFVEQIGKNKINVRTFERGVEGETKACGTGSVASGIISYLRSNPDLKNKTNATIKVKTKSSEILDISFDLKEGICTNVWLKGSATFIAKGVYYV